MTLFEAVVDAAKLRFRPILMTSMAFNVGAVPLVTSTGAGSASRHEIGTGVIGGGMLFPTVFGLFAHTGVLCRVAARAGRQAR